MKYIIYFTVSLVLFNLFMCAELYEAWNRNERLADINTEQYRRGVHQNDYIDRLEREAQDKYNLCNRIIIDKGGIVFEGERVGNVK